MKGTNILARMLDWLSEVFDVASPSLYKMLSTLVPYLAPVPVALLTAGSSIKYLGMSGWGAGIFVFVLDGLGILATVTLVSVVVDFIRSRNWKTLFMVLLFVAANVFYIQIVVSLNVRLAEALGNADPIKAKVLTLISWLPILAGVMNGYFVLTSRQKTETEKAQEKQAEMDAQIRQEQMDFKLKRAALKHGFNPFAPAPATLNQDVPQVKDVREKHASDYKDKAVQFILDYHKKNGSLPAPKHLTERFNLEHSKNKGYFSTLIREVANKHQIA